MMCSHARSRARKWGRGLMEAELERLIMAHSPRLQEILAAARQRINARAGISDDEFWKDVEGVKETKKRVRGRAKPA
jgi:hypothetical protein